MKRAFAAITLAALMLPLTSHARDTTHHLDFHSVVAEATQAGRLDGSVKFYLAGQSVPGKVERLREAVTNKKTNAFNKSDENACAWVLQSALITLQNAAKQAGANAVVDIVSFYKRNEYKDAQKYECHAGAVIAGVALKGQLARVN
ncbi:MAG: excinuclease ATPase subunit [Spongiibacteraceae bacterium]|nr:excinuclease ATPase subunit [Spongiibacteraceae bacterium]